MVFVNSIFTVGKTSGEKSPSHAYGYFVKKKIINDNIDYHHPLSLARGETTTVMRVSHLAMKMDF